MAETPTPVTPGTSGGASKLALLISFVAGAFAAWIIISTNIF